MIKTIIFDWGGVCERGKLAQELAKKLSSMLKRDPGIIAETYLKYCYDYQVDKITARQFWKKVQAELKTNYPHDKLVWHHHSARKINKGVIEIIKRLKKNYRVILVSNTYKEYFAANDKKFGIADLFDDLVLSYEVRSRKPSKRIYQAGLKKAGCKASECIFIEDKEKHLIEPRRMGMKTIVYRSLKDFKERLRKAGVRY